MPSHKSHHPRSRGRYFMQRGWQEHPVFPTEPFTQREAWEWMIAEASWRDERKRIGDHIVPLQRGQLSASVRYLAECWQWTKARVERFLKRLKTETMIETQSETGINVITICNYEKYQSFSADTEADGETRRGTVPRQQRDKIENNQEDYTNKDSEESLSLFGVQTAPPAPRKKADNPAYSLEFEEFWQAYPRHNGSKKEAFKAYQTQIKRGISHERLKSAAQKYSAFLGAKMEGRKFVKHASGWLAGEFWENDYSIETGGGGNAVSNHGRSAANYLAVTQKFIDTQRSRASALEETPHR